MERSLKVVLCIKLAATLGIITKNNEYTKVLNKCKPKKLSSKRLRVTETDAKVAQDKRQLQMKQINHKTNDARKEKKRK